MCIIFIYKSACARHVFFVITKCCFFPPSSQRRMKCSWRGMNGKKETKRKKSRSKLIPSARDYYYIGIPIFYITYTRGCHLYIHVCARPSSTRNNWLVSFATKDRYTYVHVYLPSLHPPPCADITWPE